MYLDLTFKVVPFASEGLQKDVGEMYVTSAERNVGVITTFRGHLEMSKLRVTEGQ